MTTPQAGTTQDVVPHAWRQLAAASGIFFAVLLIVSIALGGAETPDHDDQVAAWTKYAVDHESDLRIGALVMCLGAFEFLWFNAFLRSVLGRAEMTLRGFTRMADLAYGGGLIGIAGITLGVLLGSASTYHGSDTPPEIIRQMNQISGASFELGMIGFSVLLIGSGFAIRATSSLPRWLSPVGVIGGLFSLLTLGILLSEKYDNFFGIFYPLAFLSLVVFAIGSSLSFLRTDD